MRDFLPQVMRRRRWVVERVRRVFERHGFEPLETPALERLETLLGKSGAEADHLLFRVLKRGEAGRRGESDLGLRYDLTVPLARVMAMNQDLPVPFRRYQLQPVWRADRPQRGRYREFLQCDVDTVGSSSLVADAECLAVVHHSLVALGFDGFAIRLNHRQLLGAMVDYMGVPQLEPQVLVALDKLDKRGREGVTEELARRSVPAPAIAKLWHLLDLAPADGEVQASFQALAEALPGRGQQAINDLRRIMELAPQVGVAAPLLRFDASLARGLDYYTGAVFETVVEKPNIGSISGGGRYDGLVGMFAGRPLPAVGVSLGIERILVVMEELGMFPELGGGPVVAIYALGEEQLPTALAAAAVFRAGGLSTQVAPDPVRFKKAMRHANRCGAAWAVLVGPDEAQAGVVTAKRMADRQQLRLPPAELLPHLRS